MNQASLPYIFMCFYGVLYFSLKSRSLHRDSVTKLIGSGHCHRVCEEKKRFSIDLCVFRPTRAGCTIGQSKASAAATHLPRGKTEPTKASDLYIQHDNENDIDSDDDDDQENVEN